MIMHVRGFTEPIAREEAKLRRGGGMARGTRPRGRVGGRWDHFRPIRCQMSIGELGAKLLGNPARAEAAAKDVHVSRKIDIE